jgi:hypothetical protein
MEEFFMANINLTIEHPTDGKKVNIILDDTLTANEVVANLMDVAFISRTEDGYELAIKGGGSSSQTLPGDNTLVSSGVKDGMAINIIPSTSCGFPELIFEHPTDGRQFRNYANFNPYEITVNEVIAYFIDKNFILPINEGYKLVIKSHKMLLILPEDDILLSYGVNEDMEGLIITFKIIPNSSQGKLFQINNVSF